MMKNGFLLFTSLILSASAYAAEPSGYYSKCENLGGKNLLEALHSTISSHTTISYSGLWTLYRTSDVDENGKIWDMYSTKRWNPGTDQCGNATKIGVCYNREHSLPKSWFKDASPMVSDAFHIYPTDGKVNSQRSNYPFGECASGTQVASSGSVKPLGKLGKSTFSGYSGTVFEPDDQYKGDFARSYFYMAACYNDRVSSWSSPMMGGNSYPVFSSWAVNLLLKWHRQDPVSEKELKRNEAVYARQDNRNPFIDHPEMVEYIWGNKTSERWTSSGTVSTEINSPLDGSVIDMGQMVAGHSATRTVALRTTGATGTVRISSDDPVFTVSPYSVPAATANSGTTFTVTYTPTSPGVSYGIITVTAGDVSASVDFTGTCVDRLPVNGARDVTDASFTATWAYIGDDTNGNYTLDVRQDGTSISGYPRSVPAKAEAYTVDGLDAATTYTYSLHSASLSSETVSVTTAEPIPSISFLYDGLLSFATEPGVPSAAEEIMIDTENVDGDFTVSVTAPFELSLDKSNWTTSVTITPDDSRMYMRLFSDVAGTFSTSITANYGGIQFDDATVSGTAAVESDFLETFEPAGKLPYSTWAYEGSACLWNIVNGGFGNTYNDPRDAAYEGEQALRVRNKNTGGVIEMAVDRTKGIGTVSFYAHRWGSDVYSTIAVEYSTDQGETWRQAGEIIIDETAYALYSCPINVAGTVRMRLRQTEGNRFIIDNIALTPHTSGLNAPDDLYHRWDAFCRDGRLMVEVKDAEGLDVTVYAIDGTTVFSGRLPQGVNTIDTATGFYIVTAGNDARTLPVK